MLQSKLFQLYQSLDKKAHRQFKKWRRSPLHNEHETINAIFDFLDIRSVFNAKTLQKQRVWKAVYPDQPYDDLKLRHLMSLSLNTLQQFVQHYETKNQPFVQEKNLASYLFERKLDKQAQQAYQKAQRVLEQTPKDETYHYHQYELEVLLFEVEGTKNRTGTTNLTNILDHARLFFMITTLRYAYIAKTHQSLRNVEYHIPLLEAILQEIHQKGYETYPLLQIYYRGYLTLTAESSFDHFQALQQYCYDDQLSLKMRKATLLMCINYAAKQLNTGNITWVRQTFELYRYGLEQELLIEENILSAFAYKNIVTLGLDLKEYNWVAFFVERYSQFLPDDLKNDYQHYNTARLAFAQGNYDQVMDLLIQADYDDLLLNIGAKVMLLKIYYQENYYDALEALLESFRVYLNRKKALSYHKKNYQNLILFVRKLLHLTADRKEVEQLAKEIRATAQLAERKWLLEQL